MQSFGEILRQVFDSIWSHRLRSFLTMFGIAWGVASLLLLIGLGEGFRSGQTKSLARIGTNVIFIFGGNAPALPNQHEALRPYTLTMKDYEDVGREAPHVSAVTAVSSRGDLKEVSAYSSASGKTMGVQPNFPTIRNVPMARGRFFDDSDLATRRQVLVLGWKSVELLFPPRLTPTALDPIGQTITVNGKRFLIVGIAEKIGRGNNDSDNEKVYMPLTTMMQHFPMMAAVSPAATPPGGSAKTAAAKTPGKPHDNTPNDAIGGLQYQPTTPELNETAKAEVHRIVARNHGFRSNDPEAFEEWDTISSSRTIGVIFTAMDVFLGGVGIVTLMLGAVGIVNIMLVTVSERTREIGLRKALGATNRSIMLQFFLEGLTLTGVSGAIGIGGAAGLMALMNVLAGENMQGFDPPRLVPWSAAMAVTTLTLAGVVAGVFPARQAALLQPVEALRRD